MTPVCRDTFVLSKADKNNLFFNQTNNMKKLTKIQTATVNGRGLQLN
jgi:hypothetical protein